MFLLCFLIQFYQTMSAIDIKDIEEINEGINKEINDGIEEINEETNGKELSSEKCKGGHSYTTPNQFAFMLGSYVQTKCGLAICSLLIICIIGVNIAEYITKGNNMPYELTVTALTICSVLSLLLVWIIQNGPYDMFTKVQETTNELSTAIIRLNTTNVDLSSLNRDLQATNEKFLQDIQDAQVVTKSMQATLMNLLTEMNKRDGSLSKVVAQLNSEIADLHNTQEGSDNKFRMCLVGLDKELTHSSELSAQLNVTTRDNMQLSTKLHELTQAMDKILESLQHTEFNATVQGILLMADQVGDSGLRAKLSSWLGSTAMNDLALTRIEINGLLQIFMQIDNVLKVTFKVKENSDTTALTAIRSLRKIKTHSTKKRVRENFHSNDLSREVSL